MTYRYGYNYNLLAPVGGITPNGFSLRAANAFPFQDNIDGYSDGPLMTNTFGINASGQNVTLPWSGADNTNQFFDLQELFNPNESSPTFTNRLLSADNGVSTYDRCTYYRLASQMGVESAPEQDKINLNYANAAAYFDANGVVTNITFFPGAETNFVPWTPLQFFTIAADKMLREYSQAWLAESPSNYVLTYGMTTNIGTVVNPTNVPVPFGITSIPVLVSNQFVYTPAVQRVLQLAANIYDATTNNTAALGANFPSVFRPIFFVTNDTVSGYTNVFVNGYEQVVSVANTSDQQLNLPVDITALAPTFGFGTFTNVNVYGVPWVIGAKKGFPNFNEFAMDSVFQLNRKVEVTRDSTNDTYGANPGNYHFNQMFLLSVSNQFGVECWNSYTNNFLDTVGIYVTDATSGVLSNDENFSKPITNYITGSLVINSASNNNNGWPGYNPQGSGASVPQILLSPASFQLPLIANVAMITNSTYRFNGGAPFLTTNVELPYEIGGIPGNLYPQPHWVLANTNNIRVVMLDGPLNGPDHVIDYVQLSGPDSVRDLTTEIITNYDNPVVSANASGDELWNTNFGPGGVPIGLISQVGVSIHQYTPNPISGTWDLSNPDTQNGIDAFRVFFDHTHLSPIFNNPGGQQEIAAAYMTNAMASPYQPTAVVVQHVDWQVNDPQVHYLASDLNWPGALQYDRTPTDLTSQTNNTSNLGQLNTWYMPWGGYPVPTKTSEFSTENAYNLALKDPLVWRSDDWDFPTYKFPTVGWLGRVHRGTPWQTVYLKSPDILREVQIVAGNQTNIIGPSQWAEWTSDNQLTSSQYYDAYNSAPVLDRLLFDLFHHRAQ